LSVVLLLLNLDIFQGLQLFISGAKQILSLPLHPLPPLCLLSRSQCLRGLFHTSWLLSGIRGSTCNGTSGKDGALKAIRGVDAYRGVYYLIIVLKVLLEMLRVILAYGLGQLLILLVSFVYLSLPLGHLSDFLAELMIAFTAQRVLIIELFFLLHI
jgi:hypothetical protein